MLFLFLIFTAMFVVNIIVITKIKNKYPNVWKKVDSPSGLLSNTNNVSFTFGYIGLRLYRKENLDSNTENWCNLLFVLSWLYLSVFIYEFYGILVDRL